MRISIPGSRLITILFACWALMSAGCGGEGDRQTPENPAAAGIARLEWDQRAESLEQVQSLTFRLYVDGIARTLSEARCRAAIVGSEYVCSSPLPPLGAGSHMIQLTSILNGVESVRSQPLVATGAASDSTGSTIAQQVALSIPAESSTVCLASNPTECYDLEPIATGLSDVSALSPAPDGRLLFIEGNARVRVVTDGAIVSEPALRIDDDDARIAGIAVDRWHFRETGFVFVAWTEASSSGETQLNVTRYREVANTLGETTR